MAIISNKNSGKNSGKFKCNICNYITDNKQHFSRHILTRKHQLAINSNHNISTTIDNFECKKCEYITGDKSDYIKHMNTPKHINQENSGKTPVKKNIYNCEICNKQYKSNSGLWRHKKNCISEKNIVANENKVILSDNELIKMIMEENAKLHAAMKEQSAAMKALIPHVGNNNNITTHNKKKFNIQIFLNETCKDAINMKDFIKNIQITLKDVMHAAEKGVLSSSRNLVLQGLQDMEITTRPIHCTDVKRNTMYIKDKDAWNKDNDNEELKKTMQCVSTKHIKAIKEWEAAHPNYMDSDQGQQEYVRIVQKITQSVTNSKRELQSTIKNIGEEIQLSSGQGQSP